MPFIEPDLAVSMILRSTAFFGLQLDEARFPLPYRFREMSGPQRAAAEALRGEGWLDFDGDGVALSAKASHDLRFFDRETYLEIIPVATKQLVRVVSFTSHGNTKDVTLEWRWAPNEIGSLLPGEFLPDARKVHTAESSVGWDGRDWLA